MSKSDNLEVFMLNSDKFECIRSRVARMVTDLATTCMTRD